MIKKINKSVIPVIVILVGLVIIIEEPLYGTNYYWGYWFGSIFNSNLIFRLSVDLYGYFWVICGMLSIIESASVVKRYFSVLPVLTHTVLTFFATISGTTTIPTFVFLIYVLLLLFANLTIIDVNTADKT